MEIKILERPDKKEWENNVMKDKCSDFLQSYSWAEIIKYSYGFKPVFLEVREREKPIAYLVLHEKFPYSKSLRIKGKLLNSINKVFHRNIELAGGPAIIGKGNIKDIVKKLLEWLETYSRSNNIRHIKLTPFKYNWKDIGNTSLKDIFQSFGFETKKWATYLVDLKQDEDSLWMYIGKSARKALKKVKEMDVVVKKVKDYDEYLEKFIKSYNKMEKEFGRTGPPLWFVKKTKCLDVLNSYYHYYYAEYKGNIVGVIGMYAYNGYATEITSSMSKLAYENKIYVQDLLHWEMFLDAKRLGCHTFDFAGVNPDPQTPKEKGIRQFKKKWGGKYLEFYIFEKEMSGSVSSLSSLPIRLYKRIVSSSQYSKGD